MSTKPILLGKPRNDYRNLEKTQTSALGELPNDERVKAGKMVRCFLDKIMGARAKYELPTTTSGI